MRVRKMWRLKPLPTLAALLAAFLAVGWGSAPASAQSIMRSPNLNISSRIPRIDPNIAGRAVTGLDRDNIRVGSPCTAAERDNGDCSGQVTTTTSNAKKKGGGGRGNGLEASLVSRTIAKEIVAEIDGTLTSAQVDALARRHGLRLVESQSFELIGTTIGL